MGSSPAGTLRAIRRVVALGLAVAGRILDYWRIRLHGPLSMERRTLWLQASCRSILACLGIESRVIGDPPARGLVVANHLSYVDIVVLAAELPCFFVAKSEIAGWPVFGKAARAGGTIFLVRTSRASADEAAKEIERRLHLPIPVLLFPEGTSTDGTRVLRFHSRLIDPAVDAGAPITAAALRYSADGVEERELCWYGDVPFLRHLWKTLGREGLRAEVRFGAPRVYDDRRLAALENHAAVEAMRAEGALQAQNEAVKCGF